MSEILTAFAILGGFILLTLVVLKSSRFSESIKNIALFSLLMTIAATFTATMIWPDIQVKEGKAWFELSPGKVITIQEYDVYYRDWKLIPFCWEEKKEVTR
jgi:hypothetical protein